ncbi:DUF7345 domain-containing protein [Haloarchaeobius amylolyticus]|uniref:DUF7345 domain-containing protein n=1 Tax=Haloarchaeobius amylolyticus TaxID=1198296 RepID=UPI00226F6EE2|nr:hypothetical protein [Haloarchaeobius amylolyticus]
MSAPRPLAVCLLACVLLSAVAGASAPGAGASGRDPALATTAAVAPTPENATHELSVLVDADGDATVRFTVRYPARNQSEAEAASAGDLATPWFEGNATVRRVFEAAADGDDSLADPARTVQHTDYFPGPATRNATHGWVSVSAYATWEGFLGDGDDRQAVGDAFTAELGSGDRLTVTVPYWWEPSSGAEGYVTRTRGDEVTYATTVDSGAPPTLVFERDAFATRTTTRAGENWSIPLGPAAGAIPAALAVVVVAGLLAARRRTDDG